ncbi:YfcE family phosphodiesterase [bacterium]|nr:YfcE family phosphodiesterase [bacterium]
MQFLIFSDIHGDLSLLDELIEYYSPDRIFGLGDFEVSEIELTMRNITGVRGNSLFDPDYMIDRMIDIDGMKILMTHGHTHGVRSSLLSLKLFAKERLCNMVFYGHTHIAHISEVDNLVIANPGSLTLPYSPSCPTCIIFEYNDSTVTLNLIDAVKKETIKKLIIDRNRWKN